MQEEEGVGIAEDGVLSSTREAALRRAQVAEEERERRERLRRFNCEADALDAQAAAKLAAAVLTQAQVRECQALLADIREEEEALLPECEREWAEREKVLSLSTEAALESSLQLTAEKAAVLQATQVNVHAN